jgi:hypothetical protein
VRIVGRVHVDDRKLAGIVGEPVGGSRALPGKKVPPSIRVRAVQLQAS